ncbi:hypothetical protein NO995_13310 [Aestuariibaculum sp. M13]|uniref:HYC_CC_PP family protein n=1 Tax=Aestuariibaculum sp. M13 TaxID=2967132 RepID=UPI002159DE81|nr:hypothetical protein [Aestuariibaculum sp. M13]MCR8668665.1 hypothetical protein [Aestuariibaculum sp. M13]
MPKLLLHKIFALGLIVLMLISTTSFTVQKRYCHDDLVGVSYFSKMKACDKKELIVTQSNINSKNCCTDDVDVIKGKESIKNSSLEDFNLTPKIFFTSFTLTYLSLFDSFEARESFINDYSPPKLSFNRQVLDQVFII